MGSAGGDGKIDGKWQQSVANFNSTSHLANGP